MKKRDNRTSHKSCCATSDCNVAQWQNWIKHMNGLWSRNPSPSNFEWLQLKPRPKTITWWRWSRSLKSGFRLHSPNLWSKRVDLLRDEHGFSYMYIIILVCMGVGRGQEGLKTLGFGKIEKCVCSFRVGKFYPLLTPLEKCFWPPPGKIHHCPPLMEKSFRCPNSFVCSEDQGFSNVFAHVPLSIKHII